LSATDAADTVTGLSANQTSMRPSNAAFPPNLDAGRRRSGRGARSVALRCMERYKTFYRDLDPNVTEFADRLVAFDADARKAARRRAALAAYRLANELERLFGAR
jgi:hypothetical protein